MLVNLDGNIANPKEEKQKEIFDELVVNQEHQITPAYGNQIQVPRVYNF